MSQPPQSTVGWHPRDSLEELQQDGAAGAHSSKLLMKIPLVDFSLFLVSLSVPSLVLLRITSWINHLHPNPSFRICVERTETEPTSSVRLLPQAPSPEPRLIFGGIKLIPRSKQMLPDSCIFFPEIFYASQAHVYVRFTHKPTSFFHTKSLEACLHPSTLLCSHTVISYRITHLPRVKGCYEWRNTRDSTWQRQSTHTRQGQGHPPGSWQTLEARKLWFSILRNWSPRTQIRTCSGTGGSLALGR